MTIDDIQKLIDQDESVTLELKKGTGEPERCNAYGMCFS